ncbi:MAG: hypothetical protein Q7U47_13915 [Paludibacter sp.]|nr:hypothetical protein [Paludibacter sp.]
MSIVYTVGRKHLMCGGRVETSGTIKLIFSPVSTDEQRALTEIEIAS